MKKLKITALLVMMLLAPVFGSDSKVAKKSHGHYTPPYPPVGAIKFIQLPVGAVKPTGWLKNTLQAWGDGITGHLHEYRDDTFKNTWDDRLYKKKHPLQFGSAGWWPFEQHAYWVDGIAQTAYILEDERLKRVADEYIDKILDGQRLDGYMGMSPDEPYSNNGDIYVMAELTLGLMSYYSATKDPRIIPAMQRGFKHILKHSKPLEDGKRPGHAWHGTGWPYTMHLIEAVLWVYSHTGDPQMIELAKLCYEAMQKVPSDWQTQNLLLDKDSLYDHHGVDVGETIRVPALYYLYSGDEDALNASIRGLNNVDKHHLLVHGGPASDEHLREKGTIVNSEFCTHTVFSHTRQQMFAITGAVKYADGVEKILFNVGPGACTTDGKAIQYMTTANVVACTDTSCNTDPVLHFLRPDGSPVTLCCAGESTRLYPNYICGAMWLASLDNGLAAACYGPCTVSAKVGDEGKIVKIKEETKYPFEEKIRFVVKSSEPVKFPLYLRIPGWCKDASIKINGKVYDDSLSAGTMKKVDRLWKSGDIVDLSLPMRIMFERGDKASVAVVRGPLVYSLKIKHNWVKAAERFPGFPDWQVRPASAWNYALCFDLGYAEREFGAISRSRTPESYFRVKYPKVPEGSNPWEHAPIELACRAKKIDSWEILSEDRTPDVPQSPVVSDNPEEEISLVPYGSTKIRITYFPVTEIKKR